MDNSNWRPNQAEHNNMDTSNWRSTVQPDGRQRIVSKIMETLKRCIPFSGPEGLVELTNLATRFEKSIYTAATSQADYLRKISMKMLTMETKYQNTSMNNTIQASSAGGTQNLPDPGSWLMDNSIMRPTQAEPYNMDTTDWRTTLSPATRQRIVTKITQELKKHLPISGPEELVEFSKIAIRFEQKMYTDGTSQKDYLRKISMKLLTIEAKCQNISMKNTMQTNSAVSAQNPPDTGVMLVEQWTDYFVD